MAPFLLFDDVEEYIDQEKEHRLKEAMKVLERVSTDDRGGIDDIMKILDVSTTPEFERRLQMILATTIAGSLEALDRVCMVICPEQTSWAQRRKSESAKRAIADFLMYPDGCKDIPRYVRERFKLHKSWLSMMRVDLEGSIHKQLQSMYSTHVGFALESLVGNIVTECGYRYMKGPVLCVDHKEVDIAIPDIGDPRILIMSSYFTTTSSGQGGRAREQRGMYEDVCRHNSQRFNSKTPAVQFINVVDGGGWIRRPDLRILHQFCDYILAESHLREYLPNILHYHMKQTTRV